MSDEWNVEWDGRSFSWEAVEVDADFTWVIIVNGPLWSDAGVSGRFSARGVVGGGST